MCNTFRFNSKLYKSQIPSNQWNMIYRSDVSTLSTKWRKYSWGSTKLIFQRPKEAMTNCALTEWPLVLVWAGLATKWPAHCLAKTGFWGEMISPKKRYPKPVTGSCKTMFLQKTIPTNHPICRVTLQTWCLVRNSAVGWKRSLFDRACLTDFSSLSCSLHAMVYLLQTLLQ